MKKKAKKKKRKKKRKKKNQVEQVLGYDIFHFLDEDFREVQILLRPRQNLLLHQLLPLRR